MSAQWPGLVRDWIESSLESGEVDRQALGMGLAVLAMTKGETVPYTTAVTWAYEVAQEWQDMGNEFIIRHNPGERRYDMWWTRPSVEFSFKQPGNFSFELLPRESWRRPTIKFVPWSSFWDTTYFDTRHRLSPEVTAEYRDDLKRYLIETETRRHIEDWVQSHKMMGTVTSTDYSGSAIIVPNIFVESAEFE